MICTKHNSIVFFKAVFVIKVLKILQKVLLLWHTIHITF